jgi:hypothetical protein
MIKIKTEKLSATRAGAKTSEQRGRFCREKNPVKTEQLRKSRSKMPVKTPLDAFRKGEGWGKLQAPSVQDPENVQKPISKVSLRLPGEGQRRPKFPMSPGDSTYFLIFPDNGGKKVNVNAQL